MATETKKDNGTCMQLLGADLSLPHLLLLHGRRVAPLLLLLKLQPPFSVLLVPEGLQLIPGKRHSNRHLLRRVSRQPRRSVLYDVCI